MNQEPRQEHRGSKWQADKTINVANMIALIMMMGGLLSWINAWMDKQDSRTTILEIQQLATIKNQERIAADLRDSNLEIKTELRASNQDVKEQLNENQKQVGEALVRIEGRQINSSKSK